MVVTVIDLNGMSVAVMEPNSIKFLQDAVRKLPPGSQVLEFGTFCGGSAAAMACVNPNVTIHTTDPDDFSWINGDLNNPFIKWMTTRWPKIQWSGDTVLQIREQTVRPYPNIICHSGPGRSFVFDQKFDLCFIDGDHHTLEIVADFWHCWAMTKPRGLIIGDDYIFDPIAEAVGMIEGGLGFEVQKRTDLNMFYVIRGNNPKY